MRYIAVITILFAISAFAEPGPVNRHEAVKEALTALKMRESDLSVLSLSTDPFHISLIDSAMNSPLRMPDMLDSMGRFFTDKDVAMSDLLMRASKYMDIQTENPVIKATDSSYPWKGQKNVPVKIREALDIIFSSFERASVEFNAAFSNIDSFQMDTIRTWGFDYLITDDGRDIDSERDQATLEQIDQTEFEAEIRTKRLFQIASKVDMKRLTNAALIITKGAETGYDKVRGLTAQDQTRPEVPDSIAIGDVIYWCETEYGLVIIGGPGKTIYRKRCAVIIDLGGDDIYKVAAGGAYKDVRFAVSIDLGGDDLYSSKEKFAFGSGGLGIGVLIDHKGNDIYNTEDFALGSASFGAGLLFDIEGDDIYSGDVGSQGAGYMGYGILRDVSGNDRYSARLYSQGFGYVGGFGLLADVSGNDTYTAQGAHTDKFSYADHHLSLSQGFGYGNRPEWSGGIGLLLDRGGNDHYVSDIFGQGASYWFAFGGLWDGGGNDVYIGYQYSQGSGTHLSAAMLMDCGGNDSYVAHGVSQGCGHDNAVGYLLDMGDGDDNYIVWDLSQGAGNANGVGIFIDEGGDDAYINKREYNVQGYGEWRRDFGSKGIMLDLKGDDSYDAKGQDSSWWKSGRFGIGIDFPAEISKEK
jgi:hypothetical protein